MNNIIPIGYYFVHRKMFTHWLWEKRKLSKWEAWNWLLASANFEDNDWFDGNKRIKVLRGELITSLNNLCSEWIWETHNTRAFLKKLTDDTMISTQTNTRYTKITICKYDSYQDNKQTNRTRIDKQTAHGLTILERNKEEKKEIIPLTPFEILFEKWKEFRKALKKPILPASENSALKSLIKISGNDIKLAEEIIEQSIANGWQGLFPIKTPYQNKGNDNGYDRPLPPIAK